MKKTPVEGMNDYLPAETAVRDKLIRDIADVYAAAGFSKITTPIVEDIQNLENSDGGDNLRLIFRIMKRGKKLTDALTKISAADNADGAAVIADSGLRYDLTLPLVRYYCNNKDKLLSPFKCIQIGGVYRAERPQKGRLREFTQCDIDIIGSDSLNCEIELMDVTAKALRKVGITEFYIKLNHRALLTEIITLAGFTETDVPGVCITLDKADKIGYDGVKAELVAKNDGGVSAGFNAENADRLVEFITSKQGYETSPHYGEVQTCLAAAASLGIDSRFEPSLVRGQGYYTGIIFEVYCPAFGGTVAGGGRYDGLAAKFGEKVTPAVGFSIGFERIYSVLAGSVKPAREKLALLYDSAAGVSDMANMTDTDGTSDRLSEFVGVLKYRDTLTSDYDVVIIEKKKKLSKQLSALKSGGIHKAALYDKQEIFDIE